jgi:hypothetical protein
MYVSQRSLLVISIMKFHPTADEEIAGNAHINHGPYNLNSTALAMPGSEWDGRDLKLLRAVLLDGLDL